MKDTKQDNYLVPAINDDNDIVCLNIFGQSKRFYVGHIEKHYIRDYKNNKQEKVVLTLIEI